MLLSGSRTSFPQGIYASHACGLLSSRAGYAAPGAVNDVFVFASRGNTMRESF
jgi:hypothetical protein